MKRSLVFGALVAALLISPISCIISNPKPEQCEIVETTIHKISEGSTYDIVFGGDGGDNYYINRGLEQGLNLEELNNFVLNKSVTLHLAKIMGGMVVSEPISQLEVNDSIIYTEFR